MRTRTALIMAGGTGGHIMPGLAVADVLRHRGWSVLWLGNPAKMEGRIVPAHGVDMLPLSFSGVRGHGVVAWSRLPFRLLMALRQVWGYLSQWRPHVVLGMGGYVAFPGGIAAALRRIPLVVHEQNAIAGTTNRILAQIARRVLTGFPGVLPNAEVVGNPVRRDFDLVAPLAQRFAGRSGPLKLLVVGGSLGANILNTVVPQSLALLPPALRPQVIHQAGGQQVEQLRHAYATVKVQADCRTFIQDIASTLAQVDVVLCRAGAMTVTEVAAVGVAALFVPFPHAIGDHQTANARYLSQAGAAWICPQADLTPQWLADWLRCRQREELQQVAHKAHQRALPQAAQHIADICEQVACDAVGRRAKPSS